MMSAVHLSAIRSRTMREGHWGFKTEARADFVKFRSRQIGSELVVGDYTEGFQSAVSSRFSVAPYLSLFS